jgi:hypothetical protein
MQIERRSIKNATFDLEDVSTGVTRRRGYSWGGRWWWGARGREGRRHGGAATRAEKCGAPWKQARNQASEQGGGATRHAGVKGETRKKFVRDEF